MRYVLLGAARRKARGFSIIEAMLSFIILLVAIMGLVVTGAYSGGVFDRSSGIANVPESFTDIKQNADEIQAQTAAQQYMDALRDCVHQYGTKWNTSCSGATAPTVAVDPGLMYFSAGQTAVSLGNFSFLAADGVTQSGCATTTKALFTCTVYVTWTEPGTNNKKSITLVSEANDQSY